MAPSLVLFPFPFLLRLTVPPSCRRFPSLKINGKSFASSPSSTVAIWMQEHLSKDAKKAVVTLLKSHIATPSSFPHPADPWLEEVRTLGSTGFDRGLKKLVQLLEVAAAIKLIGLACHWDRKVVERKSFLKGFSIVWLRLEYLVA